MRTKWESYKMSPKENFGSSWEVGLTGFDQKCVQHDCVGTPAADLVASFFAIPDVVLLILLYARWYRVLPELELVQGADNDGFGNATSHILKCLKVLKTWGKITGWFMFVWFYWLEIILYAVFFCLPIPECRWGDVPPFLVCMQYSSLCTLAETWWVNLGGKIMKNHVKLNRCDLTCTVHEVLPTGISSHNWDLRFGHHSGVLVPVHREHLFDEPFGRTVAWLNQSVVATEVGRRKPRSPFTSLYCNCIHEALQNAILHMQTGTSWIEYSIGAVKLLFSVNFHKKFHDFALRLSLRLSQSYHDAYSNMQGYARLNRASITNTTVQDCHCVESFCATIKVESSPLSPSLQSADSPS